MTSAKRTASACAAVLLSAVLLCSIALIAVEANHNCIGENCPVCAQIDFCGRLLKTTAKTAAVLAAAAVTFFIILIIYSSVSESFDTPVSLKIKLTN